MEEVKNNLPGLAEEVMLPVGKPSGGLVLVKVQDAEYFMIAMRMIS